MIMLRHFILLVISVLFSEGFMISSRRYAAPSLRWLLREQFPRKEAYLMAHPDHVPTNPLDSKRKHLEFCSKIAYSVILGSSFLENTKPSYAIDLPECTDSVTIFQRSADKKSVILIGTAHISQDSVNLVRRTIRTTRPDVVMIELDAKRISRAGITMKTLNDAGFDLPIYRTKTFPFPELSVSMPEEKMKSFVNLMVKSLTVIVVIVVVIVG